MISLKIDRFYKNVPRPTHRNINLGDHVKLDSKLVKIYNFRKISRLKQIT